MSHTTKIKSITIKDTAALATAVAKLQAKGINIELKQDATPRMFYRDQLQMHKVTATGKADYVLSIPASAYDVALVRNEKGEYDVYYDNFSGQVRQVLGQDGNDLGKFLQAYSVEAVTNAAMMQGYTVMGSSINDKGEVELEVYVNA